MTERILGEVGSTKRRRFLLLPVLATTVFALFWIAGAQAVHDLGLFELDRNAVAEGTPGEDWETLYAGGANTGGTSDDFSSILPDIGADGGTQFHGGGSKDDLDITEWLWKAGEPLDKDDITNAYAAAYTNTVDTPNMDIGDLIVYYGLDRFSAAGSAQVGFWFLQDPAFGTTQTKSQGGLKFSGVHQDGDILVQSNFSGGGVIDSVTVYSWQSGALVVEFAAADCIPVPPATLADDLACATVMRAGTAGKTAPWSYTPKANEGPAGTFIAGGFFEGGINITQIVPNAGCFTAFVAETRSSTPFDAVLKDFVVGDLDTCVRDVRVLKTPDAGTANAGDTISFSMNVKNIGTTSAANVTLTDNLPNSGLNWSITSQPAGTCEITGAVGSQVLSCNFGTLAVNEERVVTISSPTDSADCGLKPNTVTVSATGDIGTTGNNTDNGQITVGCPDVSVVKTPDEPTNDVNAGQNAVFSITVTNSGPGSASNVTLSDNLPNTGLTWSETSDPANACDVSGAVGSQVLSCSFGTLAQGATRTVSVSSPTTVANCGTISNTVTITATGDIDTTNNSNAGEIDVVCGAIRINKDSLKDGTAVNNAGAVFSITGSGITGSLSVTDDLTAAAPDEDATRGKVCVSGLQPGQTYTVNETSPPSGYAAAPGSQANRTVVAVAGDCTSTSLNAVTFTNAPLSDIQVRFRDGGSGETVLDAGGIDCNNATGTSSTADTTDWDDTLTVEDIQITATTITVTCTIPIDP